MDNRDTKKDILAYKIKAKKNYVNNIYLLLNSYRALRNTNYLTSSYRQSSHMRSLAQKFSKLVNQLEESEELITQLEQELISLETIASQKKFKIYNSPNS